MYLKFWKRREKKERHSLELSANILGGSRITADRISQFITAYKISDIIYTCISRIQKAAVMVPWYLYQQKDDEVLEIQTPSHPLVRFLQRPGKRMPWSKYIERHLGYLLLTGNSYQRPIVPSNKTMVEFEFLRPDRVTPKMSPGGNIRYEYWHKGRLFNFEEEEIIHISLYNPEEDEDHLTGLSPITPIMKGIDISNYAKEWIFRLLESGALPPLILRTNTSLNEEQKKFLREQIKTDYLGPWKALEPLILEGGLDVVKDIGFSPKDLEFNPILKTVLRQVANVYGIPSELLGDSENKTYSNVKEAEKSLYYKATLPHLRTLRDELNSWLIPKFDDTGEIFFDYDTSGLDALSEDMSEIWERAIKAVERGIITRNEAREMMKYGRSEEKGADKLTVSAMFVPLEAITGSITDEE